jgi:hypothetical protein
MRVSGDIDLRIQVALHHGDTKIAQLRVEEWLAVVPPPFPFESTTMINGVTNGTNGSMKTKDHYGKVVELYCLFLLPKNEEWDFANTFIDMNEYLSDSKKKVMSRWKTDKDIHQQTQRPQTSTK